MRSVVLFLIVAAWPFASVAAGAKPAQPPRPKRFLVHLRYDIDAPRDQHVAQYDAMVKHLQSLDFDFVPPLDQRPATDREDTGKNEMSGYIASDKFRRILENESIASMVLIPEGFKLPEPAAPVEVRIQLASGFDPRKQREFSEQVEALLPVTGFGEAVGYDHRGYAGREYTRLVGVIPRGALKLLLKDLRRQPTGWLAPVLEPTELPAPLRNVSPILITEVLPSTSVPLPPRGPGARPSLALEKLDAELWTLFQEKDLHKRRIPVEIVLSYRPEATSAWRRRLAQAAPGMTVQGELGPIITSKVRIGQLGELAKLEDVSVVREPRGNSLATHPVPSSTDNAAALKKSKVAELHKRKARGQGVRLAVVDSDFTGLQQQMKAGALPSTTRLVDLTTVHNSDLYPDPMPAGPGTVGHGTSCALAAALAAPEAQITLVRVDGSGPHELKQIVTYIQGDFFSDSLQRRLDEITSKRAELRRQRKELLKERQQILDDFTDESDIEYKYGFLGVVRGWIFSDRVLHRQRWNYQERQEAKLRARYDRFVELVAKLKSLQGIQVVANGLTWNSGYSVVNRGALGRWMEESAEDLPLIFQAAGDNRKQAWNGFFHDSDQNGVLEFKPPSAMLGKGQWTDELNFLAFKPYRGKVTRDLPAGAKVRLTLQWQEPHDPDFFARRDPKDPYLEPLAPMQIIVLRQRDPEAKKLPADLFEVVARSVALPQRIDNHPNGSVYEHVVDFKVDGPGRYAVRIERLPDEAWVLLEDETGAPYLKLLTDLTSPGIRPAGIPDLAATARSWELKPRLFVELVDKATSRLGRPIFADFATEMGTVGVAGMLFNVVTVGAADLTSKPQPYSTMGSPANRKLVDGINVFAFDGLQLGADDGEKGASGTAVATSFAAGIAASLISAGVDEERLAERLRGAEGRLLSSNIIDASVEESPGKRCHGACLPH